MARSTKKQREEKNKVILSCRDRRGRVIPELVVEEASDPKSILHAEFIWDDKKAAHEQRLDRARELIREVKFTVVYDDVKVATPYYVSDPSSKSSAYIPTTVAAKDEAVSETVLLDELRRIESAINRARSLASAFDLVAHFDRMLESVVEVRGKISRRTASADERRMHI